MHINFSVRHIGRRIEGKFQLIKGFLRSTIGIGGKHLGPLMRRIDSSLTILALHDVTDTPSPFTTDNDIWVSTDSFKKQMEFAAENFTVIAMQQTLKGDIPNRAAMITFDDGYAGTFNNALPILDDMRMPSTIFLNMSPINGGNFWAEKVFYLCSRVPGFLRFLESRGVYDTQLPQLQCTQDLVDEYDEKYGDGYRSELDSYISPYVSHEVLREAGNNSLVTLGNHMYTHYNVRGLTDRVLDQQYQKNSSQLAKFTNYLPVFAFPFGQPELCFTKSQATRLLDQGALRLFSSWPQPNADHTAKVLDRIPFTPWHDRATRMWFQVLRHPLSQLLGRPQQMWDYPQP